MSSKLDEIVVFQVTGPNGTTVRGAPPPRGGGKDGGKGGGGGGGGYGDRDGGGYGAMRGGMLRDVLRQVVDVCQASIGILRRSR